MSKTKRINVVGLSWHTSHQASLAKLSFIKRYDLVITNRVWAEKQRPFPSKCRYVPNIPDNHDYDLAIMHIDQQCVEPRISKGVIMFDVLERVRELNIPTIIINHMTPFSDRLSSEEVVARVKELVQNDTMVVNSKTAATQWGFGQPIIHGLSVDEWYNLPKEPRILTVLTSGGMEKAYRRSLLYETMSILEDDYGTKIHWIGGNAPSASSFDEYRTILGQSLIFFMPTWQSPMPRARTEAMLSGCCIVSTKHQDWQDYIDHGKTGFIVKDNPQSCAKLLYNLVSEYKTAYQVGQAGRLIARGIFNHENFEKQWYKLLKDKGIL